MSDSVPLAPGAMLAEKYRVERVLGRGGMGVVVAATNTLIDQRVALKFLLAEAVTGVDTIKRFVREAKAAARIQSEHVVRVLDVGTLDNGLPYMVMEYLEGQDLGDLVGARGALPLEEAVGYVLQACEALAEAHAAGIVHRDIKPSNIFLARRATGMPSVKLLDFGISKVAPNAEASRAEAALTRTSAVMGSPLYMAPEQMTSAKTVDARADIWSLGATLYELLGGRPPFLADTLPELIASVLQTSPQPIRTVRPDLPASFEAVLARCLEKDRERRFASVADLALALAPFGPKYAQLSLERISALIAPSGPVASVNAKAASVPPPAALVVGQPSPGVSTVSSAAWGEEVAGIPRTKVPTAAWVGGAVVVAIGAAIASRSMLARPTTAEAAPSATIEPARTSAPLAAPPVASSAAAATREPVPVVASSARHETTSAPRPPTRTPAHVSSKPAGAAPSSTARITTAASAAPATTSAAPAIPTMGVK